MEQAIQIFSNPQFGEIRTAGTADKPMFCASDVAKALGYANPAKAIIDHCKGVTVLETPTAGGLQQVKYISEPEVYRLIFKSNAPNAELFNSWLAEEVLPSIRKTGGYIAATNDMTDDEIMAKALLVAQSTIERRDQRIKELETANKQQQAQLEQASCQISEMSKDIDEMKPKADYFDMLLNNKSTVLTTQIAQDYGMSAIAFNKVLANLGVQHKMNGQWILKSKFASNGYVKNKTIDIVRSNGMRDVKIQTVWTPNGMIFLYGILKKNGILPMIER